MNPLILYDNVLQNGVLSATDTETDYDVLNIVDLKSFSFWKGDKLTWPKYITVDIGVNDTADILGIFTHNLATLGLEISVESTDTSFDDSAPVITERLAPFTPTTNKMILKIFTSATAQAWRIKLNNPASSGEVGEFPYIGVATLGSRMLWPNPAKSPLILRGEKLKIESARSKTGQHLGSIVKYNEIRIRATLPFPTQDYVVNTFLPFWDNHASLNKPFFWAIDIETFPTEVYWAKFRDRYRLELKFSTGSNVDEIKFDMIAIKETT